MSPTSRLRRTWLSTLALCTLAGGLLLFFTWSKSAPEGASPILSHVEAVQGLTLMAPDAEAIVIVRRTTVPDAPAGDLPADLEHPTFEIVSPRHTPADTPRVKALLALLVALGAGEVVEDADLDKATFGLEAPVFRLELDLGATRRRIELGRKNPFDARRYLRLDGNSLRLVSDSLLPRLDGRLVHWREKRIIPDPPETLDHLDLKTNDLSITLERQAGRWVRIHSGTKETTVNSHLARALIRDLTELRAVAFDLTAEDGLPAKHTPPEALLRVGEGPGQRTIELHALARDAEFGILAHNTPLSPWVRLRPEAFALILRRFSALDPAGD